MGISLGKHITDKDDKEANEKYLRECYNITKYFYKLGVKLHRYEYDEKQDKYTYYMLIPKESNIDVNGNNISFNFIEMYNLFKDQIIDFYKEYHNEQYNNNISIKYKMLNFTCNNNISAEFEKMFDEEYTKSNTSGV